MTHFPRLARVARFIASGLASLVALACLLLLGLRIASDPVPSGESGPAADALARKIERAVRLDAWHATGALRFTFMGRHQHLWDKQRNRAYVRWGDHEAAFDLGTRQGCARTHGQLQSGETQRHLIEQAYAYWINDSFWLNPLGKLFDPGVIRKVVELPEHGDALLITFTQRGLTPGDSYLWLLDSSGRPIAWRMWTKIPLDGVQVSWEGFQPLATGALVSTHHEMLGIRFDLEHVAGASSWRDLLNQTPDPFVGCQAQGR